MLVAVVAALVLVPLVTPIEPVGAIEPGSLAGIITDVDGDPLGHIGVTIFHTGGGLAGSAFTGADGTYTSPDLAPGSYGAVAIMPLEDPWCWEDHPHCNPGDTDPITVTSGATTGGIDFQWDQDDQRVGMITGTRTDSDGDPLPLALATLYDEGGLEVMHDTSGTDGGYGFSSVPPGSYHVLFDPLRPGHEECFDDLPRIGFCQSGSDVIVQPGLTHDVAESPFCGAIAWGLENLVFDGFVDGLFHPTAPVSRQAMAAFLHRYDQQVSRRHLEQRSAVLVVEPRPLVRFSTTRTAGDAAVTDRSRAGRSTGSSAPAGDRACRPGRPSRSRRAPGWPPPRRPRCARGR